MGKKVVVHGFRKYDISTDETKVSAYKATAERIEAIGCELIPGTAETIDADLLDEEQRYKPKS